MRNVVGAIARSGGALMTKALAGGLLAIRRKKDRDRSKPEKRVRYQSESGRGRLLARSAKEPSDGGGGTLPLLLCDVRNAGCQIAQISGRGASSPSSGFCRVGRSIGTAIRCAVWRGPLLREGRAS